MVKKSGPPIGAMPGQGGRSLFLYRYLDLTNIGITISSWLRDQILSCAIRIVEAKNRLAEAEAEYDKLLLESGLTGEVRTQTNGASPPDRKSPGHTVPADLSDEAPQGASLQKRLLRLVKSANGPISTDAMADVLAWDKKKVGYALQALQSKRREIKRVGKGMWVPA